ncbi:hypothetical protein BC941DRAFT_441742 [Chlamydoabsidia padenii]|nr:hypothetical protein BC941DRAFT_441742 [Chlamydoabsidia padenii]
MLRWRTLLSRITQDIRLEEPLHVVSRPSLFLPLLRCYSTVAKRSLQQQQQQQQHYCLSTRETAIQHSIASKHLDQAKKQLKTIKKMDRFQTWRPLILLARRHNDLRWLQVMVEHGGMTLQFNMKPDLFDYHALMYCYGAHHDLEGAKRVFGLISTPTVFTTNTLLGCYQKCGAMDLALDFLKCAKVVDVGSYNTVLHMLKSAQEWDQAKSLYKHMPVTPDGYTYSTMLSIATQTKNRQLGQPIYQHLLTILQQQQKTTRTKKKMKLLDTTSINAMLSYLVTVMDDVEQALDIYNTLAATTPDTITCNIILDGLLKHRRNPGKAAAMVHQMTKRGHLVPDETTLGILMDAESLLGGDLDGALTLFEQAIKTTTNGGDMDRMISSLATAAAKLDHDEATMERLWKYLTHNRRLDLKAYNGLMHGLAKHGRADLCQTLYDRVFRSHSICVADVATFTSLMLAYINNNQVEDAMEIYHVLREQHYKQQLDQKNKNKATTSDNRRRRPVIQLDSIFYTTLISALTGTDLERALELFKDMRQLRISPSVHTYTAMLHWCGQCGDLNGLEKVHRLIKMDMALDPDVGIYNALMDGYNRTDQIDQVLYLWDVMVTSGYDNITISIVLDACGHHGQVKRGHAIWSFLQKSTTIRLSTNNYNSYIEFLCRVGGSYEQRWNQAYDVVTLNMLPISNTVPLPDDKTFNTLFSFARKYGLDRNKGIMDKLDTLHLEMKRLK